MVSIKAQFVTVLYALIFIDRAFLFRKNYQDLWRHMEYGRFLHAHCIHLRGIGLHNCQYLSGAYQDFPKVHKERKDFFLEIFQAF
jgi:hypothetical protein